MPSVAQPQKRLPVPRGIDRTGPVIFSYGFRPFFLASGIWAIIAMALWIGAILWGWELGGSYGAVSWHAHEMLFGYSSAALAGFLLTSVPNWTGRLPVSGLPLIGLFGVWCAGRLAMIAPDFFGTTQAIFVDLVFLPLLLTICVREIYAGKKWKDVKILTGVLILAIANVGFHASAIAGGDIGLASRSAVSAYILLIMILGGRIVPSFTRNWLAKQHQKKLPLPFSGFDIVALLVGVAALLLWSIWPDVAYTGSLCFIAAAFHFIRLGRWKGWLTGAEKLVLVLHVGYVFVPLGFTAVGLSAFSLMDGATALHIFTVGAIGMMTMAVMTRATRGHTGAPLAASTLTIAAYAAMAFSAVSRPLSGFFPDVGPYLLSVAGMSWMLAFALYLVEYGPMLMRRRRDKT